MYKNNVITIRGTFLFIPLLLVALIPLSSAAVDYYLKADVVTKIMPDGASIQMWGFASCNETFTECEPVTVPGPMLVVPPGDTTLTIHLMNNLTPANVGGMGCPVSIIIPGQLTDMTPVRFGPTPYPQYEGRVRSFTHETPHGSIGTYTWSNFRPGTYIYQSGTHPQCHVQMGLYGGVKKDAAANEVYPGIQYDNEVILFYSEIDPAFHEAIATGNYGPGKAVTSTINYKPKYFLINGAPYPSASPIMDHPLEGSERVLVRFLNAGLQSHVPTLQDLYMSLIAEDGNLYPYPKNQYSVLLAAGKTIDAIVTPPQGVYPIYDHNMYLTNVESFPGGMLTYLEVEEEAPPFLHPADQPPYGNGDVEIQDIEISAFASAWLSGSDPEILDWHVSSGGAIFLQGGCYTWQDTTWIWINCL